MKVYVVTMVRVGSLGCDYLLGVFSTPDAAWGAAAAEEADRGGKYEPEITVWDVDVPLKNAGFSGPVML